MTGERFIITTRPAEKVRKAAHTETFEIINCPLTSMNEVRPTPEALALLREFQPKVIVLTSEYGAEIFFKDYSHLLNLKDSRFIAIGPSTARIIEKYGYEPQIPEKKDSYGIAELIGKTAEKDERVGLFRSNKPNRFLDNFLTNEGFEFIDFILYEIKEEKSAGILEFLKSEKCFGVILTSSLEAEIFRKIVQIAGILDYVNNRIKVFPIGKRTLETMDKLGIKPSEPFGDSDLDDLIGEISKQYSENR